MHVEMDVSSQFSATDGQDLEYGVWATFGMKSFERSPLPRSTVLKTSSLNGAGYSAHEELC